MCFVLIRPLRGCRGRQQMLVGVNHPALNIPHVWKYNDHSVQTQYPHINRANTPTHWRHWHKTHSGVRSNTHKQTTERKIEGLPHHLIMIMTFTDARHVLVYLNHLPQCQLCRSFSPSFSIPHSLVFLEANLVAARQHWTSETQSKINSNPQWCFCWSNVFLIGGVGE